MWIDNPTLYIFWFLHQTTTYKTPLIPYSSCISFDSYIKPQLLWFFDFFWTVVYLLIPTSNHNLAPRYLYSLVLYIFWFLHQTTTLRLHARFQQSCISFDSYIKPQPLGGRNSLSVVVYLLIPTSNHNWACECVAVNPLYIFWFLHQTTTHPDEVWQSVWLYIFWFLHQTTTYRFECTDFQYITTTLSNKKWWVGYNF